CRFTTASLDAEPSYEIVSYSSGNSHKNTPVEVEGLVLQVSNNLEVALWHFRYKDEPLVLRADAVCINQKGSDEAAHQVGMMGGVFRHCSSAYVLL
ncbi:hypothetical protein GQ43DRAFT_359840, partial [Delitschia confertaspora ATCC 74209]